MEVCFKKCFDKDRPNTYTLKVMRRGHSEKMTVWLTKTRYGLRKPDMAYGNPKYASVDHI